MEPTTYSIVAAPSNSELRTPSATSKNKLGVEWLYFLVFLLLGSFFGSAGFATGKPCPVAITMPWRPEGWANRWTPVPGMVADSFGSGSVNSLWVSCRATHPGTPCCAREVGFETLALGRHPAHRKLYQVCARPQSHALNVLFLILQESCILVEWPQHFWEWGLPSVHQFSVGLAPIYTMYLFRACLYLFLHRLTW